jgi:hypothetical protein
LSSFDIPNYSIDSPFDPRLAADPRGIDLERTLEIGWRGPQDADSHCGAPHQLAAASAIAGSGN